MQWMVSHLEEEGEDHHGSEHEAYGDDGDEEVELAHYPGMDGLGELDLARRERV
jgi:hypothetical protein